MVGTKIATEKMYKVYKSHLMRYYNDFKVFTCDASLATFLQMLYETVCVMSTPAGQPVSVSNINLPCKSLHSIIALGSIYTSDIHKSINTRMDVSNLMIRLGKEDFHSLCVMCGLDSEDVWGTVLSFCSTKDRLKSASELKESLTQILLENEVSSLWVKDPVLLFDATSNPEMYLECASDRVCSQIEELYSFSGPLNTFFYAVVSRCQGTMEDNYSMSQMTKVFENGKWLEVCL